MVREFDVIVYGATGDAGRAIGRYLANQQRGTPVRWAVAGRNRAKLEALVSQLSGGAPPSVLIADSGDFQSLVRMAQKGTVVISAAGPYIKIGEPVMAACIEAGTHYADITGEVFWVSTMEAKYGAQAVEKGVCLASLCGYDCIPCEILIYNARAALKLPPKRQELLFAESVACLEDVSAPRGTILTVLESLGVGRLMPVLNGWTAYVGPAQLRPALRSLMGAAAIGWSPHVGAFTYSHFMAWCNVPVIHKAFGAEGPLRFHDRMMLSMTPAWWNLWHLIPIIFMYAVVIVCFPLLFMAASIPPARKFAENLLLSSYSYKGHAKASITFKMRANVPGKSAVIQFSCPGDPGIYATALMAAESSLALAAAAKADQLKGGFTTPVVALGDRLCQHLSDAGCKFEITVTTSSGKTD